ncbi:hypothetical protein evm_000031 [Chilo suppressalis]|nr:hypothetical protein evm_000031 [Chilo suppressalis]
MPTCTIKTCKSDTRKHTKTTGITFHEFPQSAERRENWINAILFTRDPNWRPSKRASICSLHFHESDFYTTNKGLRRLKKTALPKYKLVNHSSQPQDLQHIDTFEIDKPSTSSQRYCSSESQTFKSIEILKAPSDYLLREPLQDLTNSTSFTSHNLLNTTFTELKNVVINKEPTRTTEEFAFQPNCEHQEPNNTFMQSCLQENINSPISSYSDINSYLESPKTYALKTKLRKKTMLADLRLKKLKKVQRINRRLIKQNCSLKKIIKDLKEKKYITSDDEQKLSNNNIMAAEIFNRMHLKKKKCKRTTLKYPAFIRKFALTLDFLSPAGYKYVRRVFDSCLPHPSTLNKWYQSIDGKPGFSEEAFRALQVKVVATTDRQLRFCLIGCNGH